MSETPESVALRLLELLMQNEKQAAELRDKPPGVARNWILNTYCECLQAASGGRPRVDLKGPGGASPRAAKAP